MKRQKKYQPGLTAENNVHKILGEGNCVKYGAHLVKNKFRSSWWHVLTNTEMKSDHHSFIS